MTHPPTTTAAAAATSSIRLGQKKWGNPTFWSLKAKAIDGQSGTTEEAEF